MDATSDVHHQLTMGVGNIWSALSPTVTKRFTCNLESITKLGVLFIYPVLKVVRQSHLIDLANCDQVPAIVEAILAT